MKPSRDSGRAQISHHTEVQGIGKLYRKGVRQGLGREVRRHLKAAYMGTRVQDNKQAEIGRHHPHSTHSQRLRLQT